MDAEDITAQLPINITLLDQEESWIEGVQIEKPDSEIVFLVQGFSLRFSQSDILSFEALPLPKGVHTRIGTYGRILLRQPATLICIHETLLADRDVVEGVRPFSLKAREKIHMTVDKEDYHLLEQEFRKREGV